MDRRTFVASALTAGTALSVEAGSAEESGKGRVRIVGVACSPRKGKTTSTGVKVALETAAAVNTRIETELIDLGGMTISGWVGGAKPGDGAMPKDDFEDSVLPRLTDPLPDGLIIGSPSYFRSISALCKAFLERLAVLRKPTLLLADTPLGALAVGGYRNGGQELVINQIQTAMLCHEVMAVGGKPRAHQGATLWNAYNDDIMKDADGTDSARKLGVRVAEAAIRVKDSRT